MAYSGDRDRITGRRLTPNNILAAYQERENKPPRDLNNLIDSMTQGSEKWGREKRREDREKREQNRQYIEDLTRLAEESKGGPQDQRVNE